MLLVFGHWVFLWFSLASVGYLFVNLFIKKAEKHSYFFYLWLGYVLLTTYLQVWSFFVSLNNKAVFLIWFLLAIWGLQIAFKNRVFSLKNLFKNNAKLIPFLILVTLLVFFASTREVFHYDAYLYQFKMVAWNKNFPVIPGLANIDERLGFNSSFLVVAAFIETFLKQGMSAFILNGFLTLSLIVYLSHTIIQKKAFRPRYFALIVFPYLIYQVITGDIASLSTDLPMLIFSFVMILAILNKEDLFYIIALAVLIPTIKLSGAMSVIIIIAIFFFINKKELKNKWPYLVLALILGISFVARNLTVSAYPFYPSPLFAFNFPWKVPQSIVVSSRDGIKAWGRLPGPSYLESIENSWSFWFPFWWSRFKQTLEFKFFIISTLLFVFILIPKKLLKKNSKVTAFQFYLPLVFSLSSIMYWFFMAPDIRFSAVYFWILFAIILIEVFENLTANRKIKNMLLSLLSFYLIIFFFKTNFYFRLNKLFDKNSYFKIHHRQNIAHKNQYGLVVYLPALRDQCGNQELICMPDNSYLDNLQYIEINNVYRGFKFIE